MAVRDYGADESLVAIQGTGWINNHCSVQGDNDHSHIPRPAPAAAHPPPLAPFSPYLHV